MNLINKIVKSKLEVVIISPHYDDAILSCSELLLQLNKKTNITIVNVFTSAHEGPYTLSAKKYLQYSGYTDAVLLYNKRKNEDENAFSEFTVSIVNLGLEDALFRKKKKNNILGSFIPEFNHVYPTYRFHILKHIAKNDYAFTILKKSIMKFNKNKCLIFAPIGIGNHADHVIVRKVCEELFDNLILYSDFPYNIRKKQYGLILSSKSEYQLQPNMMKKKVLIKKYKSQFNGLFPNGIIPDHKEIYFVSKNI